MLSRRRRPGWRKPRDALRTPTPGAASGLPEKKKDHAQQDDDDKSNGGSGNQEARSAIAVIVFSHRPSAPAASPTRKHGTSIMRLVNDFVTTKGAIAHAALKWSARGRRDGTARAIVYYFQSDTAASRQRQAALHQIWAIALGELSTGKFAVEIV